MNKSLEYIISRIKSGDCKNMTEEEFSNMTVIPFNCNNGFTLKTEVEQIKINEIITVMENPNSPENPFVTLTYNPNADFDYFTLETCWCDGTLVFVDSLIGMILRKILLAQTCYSPALEKCPEGIDSEKHRIHYTVGDFIFNSWITDSPDPKKPWMCDKFTVMLPIKFDIEEF